MRISDWSSDVCSSDRGMVMRLPERDSYSYHRDKMYANLSVSMGGRVAEELIFGYDKVSSGASGDIQYATGLARDMVTRRSEEHTSELQSLMRISYAVFCLKKKKTTQHNQTTSPTETTYKIRYQLTRRTTRNT